MTNGTARQAVRHTETAWIPMSDGTRLAARLWIPEGAEQSPVPAILEYIPYRRRDGQRERDDVAHSYVASHGYACIRLDIRGTGDSEGVLHDEYTQQEQDDACDAIAWLAEQPWCDGKVGMMGISWGGFNALQVAARRPAALKAIVTVCSTDDRYADDMHYMGGAVMTGGLEWGSTFFSLLGLPPDPVTFGDGWRAAWLERLDTVTPIFADWLAHQRRDAFWQHGSVCEDIAAIDCAVLAVGGWADGYSNAVFRLLRDLKVPCRGIVGPWGHKYPHVGMPGPAIGFLTEMLRWWDQWLKGRETGVMSNPAIRAYVQDWISPASHHDHLPGRWVGEPSWPSLRIAERAFYLNGTGLADGAEPGGPVFIQSPSTTGAAAGEWCPYSLGGLGPELPTDQREDDAFSLVFDGPALTETVEILGAPKVTLAIEVDRPVAQVAVRLNDVASDGSVARVTYGILNLTHRDSHATPEPLVPGERYTVTVKLNDIGYRFAPGHRIRIAVSTAYWPIIWPSPEPVRLGLHLGMSSLSLPVRGVSPDESPIVMPEPEALSPAERRVTRTGTVHRIIAYDIGAGEQRIDVLRDEGRSIIPEIGVETGFHKMLRYRVKRDDPASARAEADYELLYRNADDWDVTVKTHSAISCTAEAYIVEADITAFEKDCRVFSRSWTRRIARDLS